MHRSQFTPLVSAAAAALAVTALAAMPSFAQVFDSTSGLFTEKPGDSGNSIDPLTADVIAYSSPVAVKDIVGVLAPTANVDLYEIYIGSGSITATTVAGGYLKYNKNGVTGVALPELFLFDSSGNAIAMNYSGTDSPILTVTGLAAADYFIGITSYDVEAMNNDGKKGTDIFAQDSGMGGNDSFALGITNHELASWNKTLSDEGGSYDINLVGATAVTPEPSMIVTGLAMFGTTGLGLIRGRARSKKSRNTTAAA